MKLRELQTSYEFLSVFLKVLESILLSCLDWSINIESRQFSFRSNTGFLTVVIVMKEIVSNYNKKGSSVPCAMIDSSKAYDCTNNDGLVGRLRGTGSPGNVVDIISYMGRRTFVRTIFYGARGSK